MFLDTLPHFPQPLLGFLLSESSFAHQLLAKLIFLPGQLLVADNTPIRQSL